MVLDGWSAAISVSPVTGLFRFLRKPEIGNTTVSGGSNNLASGTAATVGGGSQRRATGPHDWVAGGLTQDQ